MSWASWPSDSPFTRPPTPRPPQGSSTRLLHTLAKDETYAIIFIVENYAKVMAEDIARYKDSPLPAVISIPGRAGSDGSGMAAIKSAVERAVGADILFKE